MKLFSRTLLLGALTFLLFTTSCNLPIALTPPVTVSPDGQVAMTARPIGTRGSSLTPTGLIPVTGGDFVLEQCQFCVNNEPHAVLIMPEQASFNVSQPIIGITCLTTEVINGRRILLCRGAQQTTFSLNVCPEGSSCTEFPVTLGACPRNVAAAIPTIKPSSTPFVSAALSTPVNTRVPRVTPATTMTPPASPTAIFVAPAAATTSAAPIVPQPGAQTPEDFIRWYFNAVWQTRNYEDLWGNYLTANFKAKVGSGIFEDYAGWWNSVDRVDVNSVNVIQNDGTRAWVRVNINFHMKDGRDVNNQEYEYSLLYDPGRNTWMFD